LRDMLLLSANTLNKIKQLAITIRANNLTELKSDLKVAVNNLTDFMGEDQSLVTYCTEKGNRLATFRKKIMTNGILSPSEFDHAYYIDGDMYILELTGVMGVSYFAPNKALDILGTELDGLNDILKTWSNLP